ncbi:Retinol-binding protein 1 [Anabarilius grahami]|uniref:Retinol-binding protein 1 n=1 Tax=Anabarilius grahami TaxID=495550 RepID=A0A3N0YEA9_ANAGA|nr:Retinol-binding protein 1 [Anabarilius grahami]
MSPVDMNGYWKMTSNENFDEYMEALDVNLVIRKIASYLIFDKEIVQNGDHFNIKTLTTFRNYHMEFDVGKEFEEDLIGVDDRKCMTTVNWEGDKLVCVQKGEKEGRGWTQWVKGDELHVEMQQCRFTDPHHIIIIILFLLLQTRKELDLLWGQDPSSLLQPERPQMLKAVFLDSSKALGYEASLMALKHTKPTHI